jgi:ABC-type uncharacterized transport system auxiliary subunit
MRTACRTDRRRSLFLVLALAASVAGCAAPKPKPWEAPPPPNDPVLQRAQGECADKAVKETQNVSPQSQASKAAVGIYEKCLTDKGFPPPPPQKR